MTTKSLDKLLGTDMFRFIWPPMQQAAQIALRLAPFESDFRGPEQYQLERVMTHLIEGLETFETHRDVWQALLKGSTEIKYNDETFWVTENWYLENGRTWKIKIADTGFMPDDGIVELLPPNELNQE